MARDKLTEYSATAADNTVCGDVNIAENSALPSDMNNFAREIMSHLKNFSDGTDAIDALTVAGDLTVDTNTLHVDAANNRVGIGTTSPAATLNISEGSGYHFTAAGGNATSGMQIGNYDGSSYSPVTVRGSYTRMDVSGTERARFTSNGLTFNGDTAAANALDDYEEGSYVPSISATDGIGTLSYSARVGRYTKVGNRVMFNAYISINSAGTVAGNLRITTPFTPANISSNHVAVAHWINTSRDGYAFQGERVTYAYISPNEPIVRFYASNGNGGLDQLHHSHIRDGTDFMVQATFQV